MVVQVDAQGKVNGFVDNALILADFHHNAIEINDGINFIQWPRLPFLHLFQDVVGDAGNQCGRYLYVIQFVQGGDDIASAHAATVQG